MLSHHPASWLRHGDLTDAATSYRALSAAPALATDGVPVPPDKRDSLAKLDITAEAAGAYTATINVYGYKPAVAILLADGSVPAVAGARGPGWTNLAQILLDDTGALGQVRESHQLEGVSGFTRLAGQVETSAGAPNIWLDFGFSIPRTEEV